MARAVLTGLLFSGTSALAQARPHPELERIRTIGKRAAEWLTALKAPMALDSVAPPPSFTYLKPRRINPETLTADFRTCFSWVPPSYRKLLEDGAPLPERLPKAGSRSARKLSAALANLETVYENLTLWETHRSDPEFLSKNTDDLAPLLRLLARERTLTKEEIREACEKVPEGSVGDSCEPGSRLSRSEKLSSLLVAARRVVKEKLSIGRRNASIEASTEDGKRILRVPTYGIGAEAVAALQASAVPLWSFGGKLELRLEPRDSDQWDFFHVIARPDQMALYWERDPEGRVQDTLYLNSVGLDRPTAETGHRIAHEFGHFLGFPDCYVSYWEAPTESVVEYYLEPANIMCSINGSALPRHFDSILEAYFQPTE